MSHPQNREVACVISRALDVPENQETSLRLVVTHDLRGDWVLAVKADGETLLEQTIGPETVTDDWATIEVDVTPYAGRTVQLELLNIANDWQFEAAYWSEITVESR